MSSPPTLTGVEEPMFVCRRHGEDVSRLTDPDPGRCRPRAWWRHVDDDRNLGCELLRVDLLHRRAEAAGSVEQDDDGVVVLAVRPVDLLVHVVLRHRVDVVLELDGKDSGLRGRSCRGGADD